MTNQHSQAISAYRTAATQVHPMVAVVKLYDEVLRRIVKAIADTRARRIEDAYINISRASLILRGLSSNLRADKGSVDMVETLKDTYISNMIALHTSFGKSDATIRYEKILGSLTQLRNAWAEIAGMPAVLAYKTPAETVTPETTGKTAVQKPGSRANMPARSR